MAAAIVSAWDALLLGALQGVLEWLPVSSSGQLALAMTGLLGLSGSSAYSLSIASHLGTAASGALLVRREIMEALRRGGRWLRVALVPLVAGAPVALLVEKLVPGLPGDMFNLLIGLLLIVTTILVLFTGGRRVGARTVDALSTGELALVGLLQGAAALPGLSRSATTVAALLLLGLQPLDAVRASLVMGVAATGAAAVYSLPQALHQLQPAATLAMLAGSLAAGLVSGSAMLTVAARYNRSIAAFTLLVALLALASALPALLP